MRISDWSSDVCSSDLPARQQHGDAHVDAAAFGALRGDEVGNFGDRHAVDDDVLAPDPAAGADLGQARRHEPSEAFAEDRKRVVSGKSVSVRVTLVGRRTIKKKTITICYNT